MSKSLKIFLTVISLLIILVIGFMIYQPKQKNIETAKPRLSAEKMHLAEKKVESLMGKLIALQRQYDKLLDQGIAPEKIRLYQGTDPKKACQTEPYCLFHPTYGTPNFDLKDAPVIIYQHLHDNKSYVSNLTAGNKQSLIQLQGVTQEICVAFNRKYGFPDKISISQSHLIFGENTIYAGQWSFCHQMDDEKGSYQIIFVFYGE